MESLECRWQKLNLSNEEDSEIIVNEGKLVEEVNKGKKSIIGNLYADRTISKEIISNSMLKIWKTSKPFLVLNIKLKTFIFFFNSREDMNWGMSRRPWIFESSLLSLKEFDGYTLVSKMDFSKKSF